MPSSGSGREAGRQGDGSADEDYGALFGNQLGGTWTVGATPAFHYPADWLFYAWRETLQPART
jgi:hypothetical protein